MVKSRYSKWALIRFLLALAKSVRWDTHDISRTIACRHRVQANGVGVCMLCIPKSNQNSRPLFETAQGVEGEFGATRLLSSTPLFLQAIYFLFLGVLDLPWGRWAFNQAIPTALLEIALLTCIGMGTVGMWLTISEKLVKDQRAFGDSLAFRLSFKIYGREGADNKKKLLSFSLENGASIISRTFKASIFLLSILLNYSLSHGRSPC